MKHKVLSIRLMVAVVLLPLLALGVFSLDIALTAAQDPGDTTTIPVGEPEPVDYVERGGLALEQAGPVIRVYKDFNAWWGENRDSATLSALGKTLGTDWFIHPVAACRQGIPPGTDVLLFTSNSYGWGSTRNFQNHPDCQSSLEAFLNTGGVLIVDMGDNDFWGGYVAPGATGTSYDILPLPCGDATLDPAAVAAGHPFVVGLNNSNIDVYTGCYVAHGNLVDGITLPLDATVLMTANFGGVQKPILAEYCYERGRVIVDTLTKEWIAQNPYGFGPSNILWNLFSYALSPAAKCNQPPVADPNGPYIDGLVEGSPVAFDGTGSSDPDGDPLTYNWDLGDGNTGTGATPSHTYADNGLYDICLTVTDTGGLTDTQCTTADIANVSPTVGPISVDSTLVSVGTLINGSADFTDPGTADTHTASCDWGDVPAEDPHSSTSPVTDIHTYSAAGIYTVQMTVWDDDGDSGQSVFQYVVVYDPSAGFVTGGGWIDSPAGAYAADPELTGKANFSFVSKYKKGADTPTGNTEFQFHAADLNCHSSSYDWLVVTGSNYARFKGVGTINGVGAYKFMLWAGDGDPDTFRIKIWEEDENTAEESVIYDNGLHQAISGGSIVIHTGKK